MFEDQFNELIRDIRDYYDRLLYKKYLSDRNLDKMCEALDEFVMNAEESYEKLMDVITETDLEF